MFDYFRHLFDTSGFPPRWYCGQWTAGHGWLHIISDLGVWGAYVTIPLVLWYFVLRRRDIPFRSVFILFGAFILACGTTHLMEAIIFWWPAYRLAGLIKLFTAIVSWATVIALIPTAPKVLALRTSAELEKEVEERTAALQSEVTRREKVEGELKEQREWFRTTLGSIADAVIVTDPIGRITYINPAAATLTGWPVKEALDRPLDEVYRTSGGRDGDSNSSAGRAMSSGKAQRPGTDTALVARDGTLRPVEDTAAPLRSPAGDVLGVVLVFRDVSERRRTETALRESESRFRQLADAMPQIVWAARPDGYLDYYNERWYEFTGFPRGQGGDQSWEPILHPEDVQRTRDEYYGAIRSGRQYQIEYRFKDRANGGYRWFLGRALPIRDDHGKIVRWFGTCTDIDDTKKAEEALREADRRKDEFLAMLAHELRNPLAPVRNAVQIMQMTDSDNPNTRWARDVIGRQVGHMARLVDDLLDVSRITRGMITLRPEVVNLTTAIDRAVETARPLIDARRHDLTVNAPAGPIWVEGDLTRLAQVFANLLNNAAKYTPDGGRVTVDVKSGPAEVVVRVRDTGVGITAELLPEVFDLFTQADRSLDRTQGGLGIGLSLVKTLAELHRGSVEAHSGGPGQGSEFIVRLPLSQRFHQTATSAKRTTTDRAPAAERVLVVDDNADAAETMAVLLRAAGHVTETAGNGPEALAAIERFRPDAVLLDIGLPGMDGYEVARRLRSLVGPELLLIAVTGYGGDDVKRLAAEAGFDRHLVKPVNPEDLQAVLRSAAV
jgi:PAS domain S-box-containing protein